jgi:acyl transferase domain-containing protein
MTYYRDVPGVAVIGFSFRLPGGADETLWQALLAGRDLVSSVEPDRWAQDTLLHPNKAEPGLMARRRLESRPAGKLGDFDVALSDCSVIGVTGACLITRLTYSVR